MTLKTHVTRDKGKETQAFLSMEFDAPDKIGP